MIYTSQERKEFINFSMQRVTRFNLNKFLDSFMLVDGNIFLDEINFILKDDNMLQTHDLNSSQVLRSLWLGTTFIGSNKEKRSIHDSCSIKHSSHENIMTLHKGKSDMMMYSEAQRDAKQPRHQT